MNSSNLLTLAAAGGLPAALRFDTQFSGALGDLAVVPLPKTQSATDSALPGVQPQVAALPPSPGVPLPSVGTEGKLSLDFDIAARRRFFNFLELSYQGSIEYKHGLDARGFRLLIEHENEIAPFGTGPDGTSPDLKNRPDSDATKSNRYSRRLRVAVYENHVAPIIEKIIGYIGRNPPKRSEKVEAEMQRLSLAESMIGNLRSALMLTQQFCGYDAARPVAVDGVMTAAIASSLDPKNALKPYLISIDPRRVIDVDFGADGSIVRFCYEEETRAKGSIVEKAKISYVYKEWYPTHWVAYEPKLDVASAEQNNAEYQKRDARIVPTDGMKVVVKDAGVHTFGRVPFCIMRPKFPTETLCDLNRALFNLTSLLFEELYNNTFTQLYILGARASEVKNSERGTGNTLVIESPEARVGSFGAVDGQAQSIRDAIADTREQLYAVAAMNETATKNVAESAEKKKRDLEGLYTTLISLVRELEAVENDLLVGMGLAKWEDETSLTRYPDKFDIASVADLLAEIESLKDVPYAPTSLKRSLAKQLASKMDPFGPDHSKDVDAAFDASADLVGSVVDLITAGALTPELVVRALGIPDDMAADVVAQLEEHAASALEAAKAPPVDAMGNPVAPVDPETGEPVPGSDPSDPGNAFGEEPGGPDTKTPNGAPVAPFARKGKK